MGRLTNLGEPRSPGPQRSRRQAGAEHLRARRVGTAAAGEYAATRGV